jgi:Serine carboxypeptidase S28
MKGQSKSYGATINVIHEEEEVPISRLEKCVKNCPSCNVTALLLLLVVVTIMVIISPTFDDHGVKSNEGSYESRFQRMENHDENSALFYDEQIIDHFSEDGVGLKSYWKHRYYVSTRYFGGPGSPIFLVIGGEGALDHGMLYPFVTDVLAKRFNAAVVQPEHRFYGAYQPVQNATIPQLLKLLTPQQAIADMLRLVTVHLRETTLKGCSPDRRSAKYCPLITIGGSYPGFLSTIFRLVHPDVVDAAYASAAPLLMYAQRTNPNVFYDIVTASAENSSPGCPTAVRQALNDIDKVVLGAPTLRDAALHVGICENSIPHSIKDQLSLSNRLLDMVSYSFADHNMDAYPPGPDTGLYRVCQVFQDENSDTFDIIRHFFESKIQQRIEEEKGCDMASVHCNQDEILHLVRHEVGKRDCFDFKNEFPDDPKIQVDWSSVPSDEDTMWNFQTCTNVIFLAGFSEESMFPSWNATLEKLTKECQDSFGVTPRPRELADLWGFDDLVRRGASRILFTNGGQDMWSGGSIRQNLSDSLLALNFENGAHHSDLSHRGPSENDTPDIKQGFILIADILEQWLNEIRNEVHH